MAYTLPVGKRNYICQLWPTPWQLAKIIQFVHYGTHLASWQKWFKVSLSWHGVHNYIYAMWLQWCKNVLFVLLWREQMSCQFCITHNICHITTPVDVHPWSGWCLIRVVFGQSGLLSGWPLSGQCFIKVVFGQSGLLSGWPLSGQCFIKVVFGQSGLLSGWPLSGRCFIKVVFGQSGLLSGWPLSGRCFIRASFHKGGVWSEWPFVRVTFIRVVFHQGSVSSRWCLVRVVFC